MHELEERLKRLKGRNRALSIQLKQIQKRQQKHDKIGDFANTGMGWYEDIPLNFLNTCYEREKELCEHLSNGNLRHEYAATMKLIAHFNNKLSHTTHILVHVKSLVSNEKYSVLTFEDPYGEISFTTKKTLTDKEYEKWADKMVLIKIKFSYTAAGTKTSLLGIKTTDVIFRKGALINYGR